MRVQIDRMGGIANVLTILALHFSDAFAAFFLVREACLERRLWSPSDGLHFRAPIHLSWLCCTNYIYVPSLLQRGLKHLLGLRFRCAGSLAAFTQFTPFEPI